MVIAKKKNLPLFSLKDECSLVSIFPHVNSECGVGEGVPPLRDLISIKLEMKESRVKYPQPQAEWLFSSK